MKTPLAWLHLTHQRKRTAVAVTGVAFTIILIFMQLGFYGAVEATATLLYDKLDFDLLLVSPGYINLNECGAFPKSHLYLAREVPEVVDAVPVYVSFQLWRSEDPDLDKRLRRQILILGVRRDERIFAFPELQNVLSKIHKQNTVLIDRTSRDILGPRAPGDFAEVGPVRIEVVDEFSLGLGFGADGLVVVSEQTFSRVCNSYPLDRVSLGLVRLRAGTDVGSVAARLRQLLPADVQVFTRAELVVREQHYWVSSTSVGIMFGFGVVVALIAGMVFIHQVVSSDVRSHFREYATLKAIGYRRNYLSGVIVHQALLLAGLGYAAGLPASAVLYEVTRRAALIPLYMNLGRVVLVLLLAILMCSLSGLLCLRKVHSADPADLF